MARRRNSAVYTGLVGAQYEQKTGVSKTFGPNGEVAGRMTWKWPTGTTEVKSYPSLLVGNKPGYANSWIVPGGHGVRLLDLLRRVPEIGSQQGKSTRAEGLPRSWLGIRVAERLADHLQPRFGAARRAAMERAQKTRLVG